MDTRETLRELEEQIYRKGRLETKLRYMQKEAWDLRYVMEVYARQAERNFPVKFSFSS